MQMPWNTQRAVPTASSVSAASIRVLLVVSNGLWIIKSVDARTDLSTQWYTAYANNPKSMAPIAGPQELPERWKRMLSSTSNDVSFAALAPTLQRALLWESGLVRIANADDKNEKQPTYAQVYLLDGYTSMSAVFVPKSTLTESSASCPLEICNENSQSYATQTKGCDPLIVLNASVCAVVEDPSIKYTVSSDPFWGQDGDLDDHEVQLFKYVDDTKSPDKLDFFTINQRSYLGLSAHKPCTNAASFIAPCRRLSPKELDTASGRWSVPEPSELLTLWLQKDLDAKRQDSSSSGVSSNKLSTTSIALLVVSIVLVIVCVVLGVLVVRKSRLLKSATTSSSSSSSRSRHTGGTTPAGRRSTPHKRHHPPLHSGGSSDSHRYSSARSIKEIELLNDALCQQSTRLTEFVDDQTLMMKRIAYNSIVYGHMMAKGANGEVWRGECEGQAVAIKRLLQDRQENLKAIEQFTKEIRLASALDHPNIVQFIGLSWRLLSELCMVSEFMSAGDLGHYLTSKKGKELSWRQHKLRMASDIASALVYLHSLMPVIIHRDLKSLNVLLNDQLVAKLSDFGLSRERSFEETMTSGIGTLLWTAPEVLRGDRYSEKADIYSFGVVLSELDTCLPPYHLHPDVKAKKKLQLMPLISRGEIRPSFRPECPQELKQLAMSCLALDPSERPNAMQIVYLLRSKVAPTLLDK